MFRLLPHLTYPTTHTLVHTQSCTLHSCDWLKLTVNTPPPLPPVTNLLAPIVLVLILTRVWSLTFSSYTRSIPPRRSLEILSPIEVAHRKDRHWLASTVSGRQCVGHYGHEIFNWKFPWKASHNRTDIDSEALDALPWTTPSPDRIEARVLIVQDIISSGFIVDNSVTLKGSGEDSKTVKILRG